MKVEILRDEECEMLKIVVDGKSFFEGNDWDFNLEYDLPSLLSKVGVEVVESDYSYEDGDG